MSSLCPLPFVTHATDNVVCFVPDATVKDIRDGNADYCIDMTRAQINHFVNVAISRLGNGRKTVNDLTIDEMSRILKLLQLACTI